MVIESSSKDATQRQPQVSIGMPVRNGESFICEALDSLLAQDFMDFELIISDNASEDRTEAICREYAAKDGRIRYVRQARDLGAMANFSFVVSESVGQYFSWLAHDDVLNSNFLSVCVDFLNRNEVTALVSGDFMAMDANGHDLEIKELLEIRAPIPWETRAGEFFCYPTSNAFFCIYGLMRKHVLVKVLSSIRRGPLLAASELPFISRFAAIGEVASLPNVLRKYRYHENSAFHSEKKKLSSRPIRGWLVKNYNTGWLRADQLMVLMRSSYSFGLKFKVGIFVLRTTTVYYLSRAGKILANPAKYLWKSKVPPKSS